MQLWVDVFMALCNILTWLRAKTNATIRMITFVPRTAVARILRARTPVTAASFEEPSDALSTLHMAEEAAEEDVLDAPVEDIHATSPFVPAPTSPETSASPAGSTNDLSLVGLPSSFEPSDSPYS